MFHDRIWCSCRSFGNSRVDSGVSHTGGHVSIPRTHLCHIYGLIHHYSGWVGNKKRIGEQYENCQKVGCRV